jgi:ferredoxin-NADP reductase
MTAGTPKINVTVESVTPLNALITRFTFRESCGKDLPAFSGGAHVVVEMDDHGTKRMNPYSLMSDPNDTKRYSITVRRDDEGRGGSLYMHSHVKAGMEMVISTPVNLFSLDLTAKKHLMIAGGIGITPFMSQIHQLTSTRAHFELHYSVRSDALGAYLQELTQSYPKNLHVYRDDQDEQLKLAELLNGQPVGTHVYVCGPKGMIDWVRETAREADWPDSSVHFEEFTAPKSGNAFEVTLHQSNKTISVDRHQSLLEALEASSVEVPYLCRGGACGQCETNVLECDGNIEHNDHWLTDDQRLSKTKIMPCVSRFAGKKLTIER